MEDFFFFGAGVMLAMAFLTESRRIVGALGDVRGADGVDRAGEQRGAEVGANIATCQHRQLASSGTPAASGGGKAFSGCHF